MDKYYSYNELKESKLLYDRRPPAFGIIMTLLTLVFVIGALLWAAFSTKTYVIRATGLATDTNKTNVMNLVSGKVESINVSEGQAVNEGDIILVIDSYETRLQISQLESMRAFYQNKIANNQRLLAYINAFSLDDENTQINPFNENDSNEAKLFSDAEMVKLYMATLKDREDGYTESDEQSLKSQILSQLGLYTTLDECNLQVTQYDSQIKMYSDSLEAYSIKAKQSGQIHLTAGLTVNTVLQAGTLIGSISSNEKDKLYFELAVSATERSKLSIDSQVEIAVSGAMQTEYGTLYGRITEIDNDSTQTENGQVYYRVKAVPDNTVLYDKKGRSIQLQLGMIGECRIKYDETTYLKWMIEQIVGKLH